MTLKLTIGGAGDAVVFIHGTPTTHDVLAPIAREVKKTHVTIEVALPGYGESALLVAPWAIADLHAAIEASLVVRDLKRVAIVGFSGGAYHALALATRRVLDVRGVVCLSGMSALTAEERDGFRGLVGLLRAGNRLPPIAGDRFLSPSFRAAHPEAVRAVTAWFDATSADNLADELDAFVGAPDLTQAIAALDIPILARVGSLDIATPPAKSEQIVAAAKRGTLEIVAGAGHALMLEDLAATTASTIRALTH